ncbi:hypothetical protein Bbelb_355780 [Branchiostoma belcheri]|nr:hypothetical protein Bbelb_355780 [Branchiostoma belcheri]
MAALSNRKDITRLGWGGTTFSPSIYLTDSRARRNLQVGQPLFPTHFLRSFINNIEPASRSASFLVIATGDYIQQMGTLKANIGHARSGTASTNSPPWQYQGQTQQCKCTQHSVPGTDTTVLVCTASCTRDRHSGVSVHNIQYQGQTQQCRNTLSSGDTKDRSSLGHPICSLTIPCRCSSAASSIQSAHQIVMSPSFLLVLAPRVFLQTGSLPSVQGHGQVSALLPAFVVLTESSLRLGALNKQRYQQEVVQAVSSCLSKLPSDEPLVLTGPCKLAQNGKMNADLPAYAECSWSYVPDNCTLSDCRNETPNFSTRIQTATS